MHILYDWLGR
ncbi:hypothetical protein LINGRAHAP2_LOCUS21471 [Linum grandiflorum]